MTFEEFCAKKMFEYASDGSGRYKLDIKLLKECWEESKKEIIKHEI